jgi:hypothetical protein
MRPMVAIEPPFTFTPGNLLTAFGRTEEFGRSFADYPVPADLVPCARLYRANCGPASFAAVTGLLVTDIIRFFPQFPADPHTNIPQMKSALSRCGISAEDMTEAWPEDGLCLIQITGPWTERAWSHAACGHRHWVGVRNGYIYDVNEHAWLEYSIWSKSMGERAATRPRATGWRLLKALRLASQPACFPEFFCDSALR